MLMSNIRYSFLVSSDEIMFLKVDIRDKKAGEEHVLAEPWLNYSEPIKITEVFDAERKTITVRMALLYLLWLVVQNGKDKWCLPDELGNSLNYAVFTKANEDWELRCPCIPDSCKPRKKAQR
jgi:hypothetical protein